MVMGNLWGNLFGTGKWGPGHLIQAVLGPIVGGLYWQLEGTDPGADGSCEPLRPPQRRGQT